MINSWLLRTVLLSGVCLGAVPADAWNATWLLNPGSSDWNTATNWRPVLVPTGTATFGASNTTTVTFSKNASVGTIQFNPGAPAYTFNLSGFSLTLNEVGLVNKGLIGPVFSVGAPPQRTATLDFKGGSTASNAQIAAGDNGRTRFEGTSTADDSGINNNGGSTIFSNRSRAGNAVITNFFEGATTFLNTSTAGNASIANIADGFTTFFDRSTAADSTITAFESAVRFSNSSTAGHSNITTSLKAETSFSDTSSAGKATIITSMDHASTVFSDASTAADAAITTSFFGSTIFNGASTAARSNIITNEDGTTFLANASTAGNATITTNSGGFTLFGDSSTGGKARFITNAGGVFDISNLISGGMTAGSVEGAGIYQLGSKTLTVGLNNRSTEVSGTIADGGSGGGTSGSLIKVGKGTFTLTGANTYTGGTTILAGKIRLGNSSTIGSIVGSVFNSSTFEIFNANTAGMTMITNSSGGRTLFENTGTAADATIINNSGGATMFEDQSTAGLAKITNNSGGMTQFSNASKAGVAVIANNGGLTRFTAAGNADDAVITNNAGGSIVFSDKSTAGHSTINNIGGETRFVRTSTAGDSAITNNSGGSTVFSAASTAGNAAITNNFGGTSSGSTVFSDRSRAGNAVITNFFEGATTFLNTSTAGNASIANIADGFTTFFDRSTAAGSTITAFESAVRFSNSSTAGHSNITTSLKAETSFSDTSSAGNATIITSMDHASTVFSDASTAAGAAITTSFFGSTIFNGASTAANSTITTNSDGRTFFSGESTAGHARIITNSGGTTNFTDTSTANSAALTNNSGGSTQFSNMSTADHSTITNVGGLTQFADTSTGGNAAITNKSGGLTEFLNSSTAGNSIITSDSGGITEFSDASTAAKAIVTTKSNGLTQFFNTSTGGQARFINNHGAIVDISSLTSSGMTAGSIEGGGTLFLGSKTLTVGLNNLNTLFNGTIADGGKNGGTGGVLTKVGTGTLTLTGQNTYSGGTNFDGGIVAVNSNRNLGPGPLNFNGGKLVVLGPGGGITSGRSIILNAGDATFSTEGGTTSSFSGTISGAGSLTKDDSGTLTLTGANTYSGGTVIDRGTLIVDNPLALGTGDLTLNGGVLRADPQSINVSGNFKQNAGGTLQLNIAGRVTGEYDVLNVGGNATLNGTLQLQNQGYLPHQGDKLRLINTGGVVTGRFAQLQNPFTPAADFNTVDLAYGRQSVTLEFLELKTPGPLVVMTTDFASFAFTPNQLAAANLLDAVQPDSRAAKLISFLNNELLGNLAADFEKISPVGLTAFYEIGFSNSNIQRLNLENRLDDVRSGSNGFSSNMKVNGATVNVEGKADSDGKSSKGVVEPILQHRPENRWGVWATGFGDFVSVDSDGFAKGYNFATGGVSLGVDYRVTEQLAIGAMGDYSHTWTSLQSSGQIDVDSGRGGLYATWYGHGIYLDGAIYGGHNNYDSSRSSLAGLATGGTEGSEWSAFWSGGYDFHLGPLSVGPIASLQYTHVNINDFSEKGSVAPLQIHSGSAESLRSDVGFRVFYQWQIGKILLQPSLKAAWEHEYKYSALPITAGFADISGPSATFLGPNEGHDSAVVSAGLSAQCTPAISTYVYYDGQLGRENYNSNAVTGGVRISF